MVRRLLVLLSLLTLANAAPLKLAPVRVIPVGINPRSVTRGFDDELFVTIMGRRAKDAEGNSDGKLVAIDESGKPRIFAEGFIDPQGIVFIRGQLIIADTDRVWTVAADGKKYLLAGPEIFPSKPIHLRDVAIGPKGHSVYITDMGPTDSARDSSGLLWPLDSAEAAAIPPSGRVYRVRLDGRVTIAIDYAPEMQLIGGIDVYPDGKLLITEYFKGELLEWSDRKLHPRATGMRTANGVVHDNANNIYISESAAGQIWLLTPGAENARVILCPQIKGAADIYIDPITDHLIVPDAKAGTIVFLPRPKA